MHEYKFLSLNSVNTILSLNVSHETLAHLLPESTSVTTKNVVTEVCAVIFDTIKLGNRTSVENPCTKTTGSVR